MAKKFAPSIQQAGYFDWIRTGVGSAVLEAVAGSGKTTTLIHGLSLMSGTVFFGAYNKKIAEEIKSKVRLANVTVSTMHAAGFAAWRKATRFVTVDGDKCRNIFRAACERNIQYSPFQGPVLQLVSLAKQAGLGVQGLPSMKSMASWIQLIQHYDVETFDEASGVDNTDLIVKLAVKTLEASIAQNTKIIDFDDMIYAPLYHGCSIQKYDWVLVDEAQDTNATRRLLALQMMHETSRLVAVGDPRQAIYQFQGASADSMNLIREATNAKNLPLTITYRCPKEVVKVAHQWVSHIQAAETAPDGVVRTVPITDLEKEVSIGDVILCRYNAPLVKYVYKLIASGVPARIEGREIGNGLKALANKWKVKSIDALLERLEKWQERETTKARAKENEAKITAIEDKCGCLRVIIARVQATDPHTKEPAKRVCAEIDSIFSDDPLAKVVTLSSIHRSKGREWTKVVWLQTGPNKRARLDWQVQAEDNLSYVACTRSMNELVLIDISAEK